MLNRRDFVRGAAQTAAGLSAGSIAPNLIGSGGSLELKQKGVTAVLPMPIQVVVDDVGWWSGHDGSKEQEPYRTGIPRNHVPEDYEAIVQLGRALNIRPQAAMILCEWDKDNILRKLPTSTWMGPEWDNKKWVGPWLEEAADIIRNNSKHLELTLHGVGHEFWADGRFTRAEWADSSGIMRPLGQVEAHLDAYEALLNQHQLGPLPSSFVPTAFLHGFGPTDRHRVSMAEMLKRRGVVYINTPFEGMRNREAVRDGFFGFDAGVMTVDRGQDLLDWNNVGMKPSGELRGPTCGMHWPNLLHLNPERNSEIVEGWIRLLQPYQQKMETLLAPNSESFRTQLIHHICTQLSVSEQGIQLDFTRIDTLPTPGKQMELILKIRSPYRLRLESDSIKIASETSEIRGGCCLYTLSLERIPGRKEAQLKVLST
jgi:hypothetical protein